MVCNRSRLSQEPSLWREECSHSRCRLSLRRDCEREVMGVSWTLARLSEMVFRSKTWFFAWASARAKTHGQALVLSPRRDKLIWAKIAVLPHCSTPVKSEIHPKQYTKHIHFKVGTIQSLRIHNKTQTHAKYT